MGPAQGRKPRQVYLDNGKQFIAKLFKAEAAKHGIKLVFGKPYSPRGRGKIEKYHGALYQELICRKQFRSLSHFRRELWEFDKRYNNWRKQEALGWQTPASVYNDKRYFNKACRIRPRKSGHKLIHSTRFSQGVADTMVERTVKTAQVALFVAAVALLSILLICPALQPVLSIDLNLPNLAKETSTAQCQPQTSASFAKTGTASIKLAAVTSEGEGSLSDLEVDISEGKGRILITTEPLIGVNTQNSERIAVAVAEQLTKTNLSDRDVIFTIYSDANIVDGPSAGAAMAVAAISAITNKSIRKDVLITGTIDEEGIIGPVGMVSRKAKAVADYGAKLFLIPKGQRMQTEYVRSVSTPAPGYYIESVKPVKIDLVEYAKEKWGLEVREVGNIKEATSIMLSEFTSESVLEKNVTMSVLLNMSVGKSEGVLKLLADNAISRAWQTLGSVNDSELNNSLKEAARLRDTGYLYSAANIAFLTAVKAKSSYYNFSQAKEEIEEKLDGIRTSIRETNTSKYFQDDLQTLAAAQQRYVWAIVSYEEIVRASGVEGEGAGAVGAGEVGASEDLSSLIAASEWLSASGDIFQNLKNSGNEIERERFEANAEKLIGEAKTAIENTQAVGGDTRDAIRSYDFAVRAQEMGLPLAAAYNAMDAVTYASANANAGSLYSLMSRAEQIQKERVNSPWAINYMKHSKYLVYLAGQQNSKKTAIDAIFLALRALGTDAAFLSLPVPGEKNPVEEETNLGERVSGDIKAFSIVLLFTFLLTLVTLYENASLRRQNIKMEKYQEMLVGRVNSLYSLIQQRGASGKAGVKSETETGAGEKRRKK